MRALRHNSILILATVAAMACPCQAGSIRTRDGKTIQGTIRLGEKEFIIRTSAGAEVKIDPADVAAAQFREDETRPNPSPASPQPREVHGLRGEYYSDTQYKNLLLVRIDPEINFEFPAGSLPHLPPRAEFSARWVGQIDPPKSEAYTFHFRLLGSGRLWVDNKLVVDRQGHFDATFPAVVELKAGQKTDIKIEFRGKHGGGKCRLKWSSPSQPQQTVPSARLFIPPALVPPAIHIVSPSEGARLASSLNVLEVAASDHPQQVKKVEFFCDDKSIGTADRAPWRVEWRDAPPGEHRILAKATDAAGRSIPAGPVRVQVLPRNGMLPAPWAAVSTHPTHNGSGMASDGRFTIRSAGGELLDDRERFEYVCQPMSDDCTIIARLDALDIGEAVAWAGLLIRERNSGERSKEAFVGIITGTGLSFASRPDDWQRIVSMEEKAAAPIWLKLTRFGKSVTAYRSADGVTWHSLGERRVNIQGNFFVGLAFACAERHGVATFDNVSVTRGSPQLQTTLKGIVLRSGSIVAGNLAEVNDTSVKMWRGSETIIPTSQVARILFRPLTAESSQRIEKRGSGVLLGNGDFVDGKIESLKDGQLRLNSVLMGARRYNIYGEEIVAAVLREVAPAEYSFEVRGSEGSIVRAKSFKVDRARLKVTDTADVEIPFVEKELAEITGH